MNAAGGPAQMKRPLAVPGARACRVRDIFWESNGSFSTKRHVSQETMESGVLPDGVSMTQSFFLPLLHDGSPSFDFSRRPISPFSLPIVSCGVESTQLVFKVLLSY